MASDAKKFISALIVFILVLSFSSCGDDTRKYVIYYKNADGNSLVAEEHKTDALSDSDDKAIITYLVEEMTKIPQTEGIINSLPSGTKLLGASIRGTTATVNLSKEYYQNKDVDELLARIAIVNTLSEIEGIENVIIKVDSKALVSTTTGEEIGKISRNDVAYGPQDRVVAKEETIVIYFPDESEEYLVAESREIEVQASLSIEKLILSELMKGPDDSSLVQIIPSDVKVIGTETKDGVCFVNLSGDFVDKAANTPAAATMALYSIVNSLTELDTIDSVQILIDGKTGVEFGTYVLDVPLEKNTSLIKE